MFGYTAFAFHTKTQHEMILLVQISSEMGVTAQSWSNHYVMSLMVCDRAIIFVVVVGGGVFCATQLVPESVIFGL